MKIFLEAGRLTAPRGLQGELRFDCWCDSPNFLRGVPKLYLDADGKKSLDVKFFRPSVPSFVFEGYETRESAARLSGSTIYFDRNDITLPEGTFFNDDLIGLNVYDADTKENIGTLTEVIDSGTSMLYKIEGKIEDENKIYLVPAIGEFVKSISLKDGIGVKLIEGLDGLIK